jgi:hypothetical protein
MTVIPFTPREKLGQLTDYSRRWRLARIVMMQFGEWLITEKCDIAVDKVSEESAIAATAILALGEMHADDITDLYDSVHAMPCLTYEQRTAGAGEIRKWALAFLVERDGWDK